MMRYFAMVIVLLLAVSCNDKDKDANASTPLTAGQQAAASQAQAVNGVTVGGQNGTAGSTSTATAGQANNPRHDAPNQNIKDIEALIIQRTNLMRGGNPTTDLKNDRILSYVSRKWSKEMSDTNKLSHAGFPHGRMQWYSNEVNGSPKIVMTGENVAMSYIHPSMSPQDIARLFVKMWMDSPPHRANILGSWEFIGVGVHKNGNTYWATQIFAIKQ